MASLMPPTPAFPFFLSKSIGCFVPAWVSQNSSITAAGAVDREFYRNFDFLVDFGVREVSQRRDLKILLQLAFGRARDDF